MTLSRSNRTNSGTTDSSSSHEPQAYPLDELEQPPTSATLPAPTLTPALLAHTPESDTAITIDPSNSFQGPPQPPTELVEIYRHTSHGPGLESSSESVDDERSSQADPNELPDRLMKKSKQPPFLRSASGFASPSYGAISPTFAGDGGSPSTGRSSADEPLPRSIRLRKSRTDLSGNSKRSASVLRQPEELGGSTTIGGLEGRFGMADSAVPTDILSDAKDDSSEGTATGFLEDSDDDEDEFLEDDPPDNSPYPQVRASVSPTDNTPDDPPEEYNDGFRTVGEPEPAGGRRSRLGRLRLWLAQGRWNEKEHSCVYVSSNVSFGFAFATDVIVEQTQFYKQDVGIVYQLLLTLSTQILGYTFAGLSRRFLVRPSGMIWPGTLMSVAMFTTLHKEENKEADGWKISRWRFFYIIWLGGFLFYFLPGLLMPALSYFNVITWFAPDSVVVANLFGVVSGLGLFPLTFDWAQIAYIGSPLLTPFWAAMNVVGGLVIVMWIIAPIAYYGNWLYASYMPILSAAVFDNKGHVYDVSKILTKDFLFDREAYQNYSRVFLPITYVLSYAVQFAGLASLLTHTACWHGEDIWRQWTRSLKEVKGEPTLQYQPVSRRRSSDHRPSSSASRTERFMSQSMASMEGLMSREDVHNRLMKRYKDAPMTWYLLTFVSMTAVGIFVVEYYPIHLPWYGLLLALGICSILFIPIGIIMAVTNQHSSIYLICQLICGAVFPGRPVANMVFVTYGYISSSQGIKFAADLKLGHYMKIPPRILFSVQMVATIVSSVTQIGVLNWMFRNVPGICTPEAINGFTCPIARVHFNGSILWGVVGPSEFFGPGATYRLLVWAFLVGALLPIPLWLYGRHRRDSIVRKINLPVLFGSLSWIPPATGLNFSVWAVVCFFFNYLVKNRAAAWWAKYTMTLSAALDSGLAFGIVVVFFGFIYPGWMKGFSWWGTEVYKAGCDWQACAYKSVPEGGHFGPDTW
ncbi:OPT-domain-containing protein [Coniochaeta hoffmannii]|uniref:OPT-domain-containing protein n=1 Tax=Coniochaeta hoffmannii TaxID=91930 RepID=A0AA38S6M7_9PEZI|nr:OPT-domain-containing protein [Coniochaeta hoffmannii]